MKQICQALIITMILTIPTLATAEPSRLFAIETSNMPTAGEFNVDLVNTYHPWISDSSFQMRIGLKKGELQVSPYKNNFGSAAMGYKYPIDTHIIAFGTAGLSSNANQTNDIQLGMGYTRNEGQLTLAGDISYLHEAQTNIFSSNFGAFYKLLEKSKNSALGLAFGAEVYLHNRTNYAAGLSIGTRITPSHNVTLDLVLLQQLPRVNETSIIESPAAVRLNVAL